MVTSAPRLQLKDLGEGKRRRFFPRCFPPSFTFGDNPHNRQKSCLSPRSGRCLPPPRWTGALSPPYSSSSGDAASLSLFPRESPEFGRTLHHFRTEGRPTAGTWYRILYIRIRRGDNGPTSRWSKNAAAEARLLRQSAIYRILFGTMQKVTREAINTHTNNLSILSTFFYISRFSYKPKKLS